MIEQNKNIRNPEATVAGIPFTSTTFDRAVRSVIDHALDKQPVPIFLSNAYCVALTSKDPEYRQLLQTAGIVYPDGTPIVWFMKNRQVGAPASSRVRGPSLFEAVIREGRKENLRHFFLGTTKETLEQLREQIETRFPGTLISGMYAPPFGPLDETFYSKCESAIKQSNAQVIWVALGTPKQDFAAAKLTERIGIPCIAVGAAFDFLAGTSREAPAIIQNSGLEWLYRLAVEPKRLWKRYLFGNATFLRVAISSRFLQETSRSREQQLSANNAE